MGTTTCVYTSQHSPTFSSGTTGKLNGTKVARSAAANHALAQDDSRAALIAKRSKEKKTL